MGRTTSPSVFRCGYWTTKMGDIVQLATCVAHCINLSSKNCIWKYVASLEQVVDYINLSSENCIDHMKMHCVYGVLSRGKKMHRPEKHINWNINDIPLYGARQFRCSRWPPMRPALFCTSRECWWHQVGSVVTIVTAFGTQAIIQCSLLLQKTNRCNAGHLACFICWAPYDQRLHYLTTLFLWLCSPLSSHCARWPISVITSSVAPR